MSQSVCQLECSLRGGGAVVDDLQRGQVGWQKLIADRTQADRQQHFSQLDCIVAFRRAGRRLEQTGRERDHYRLTQPDLVEYLGPPLLSHTEPLVEPYLVQNRCRPDASRSTRSRSPRAYVTNRRGFERAVSPVICLAPSSVDIEVLIDYSR